MIDRYSGQAEDYFKSINFKEALSEQATGEELLSMIRRHLCLIEGEESMLRSLLNAKLRKLAPLMNFLQQ